MHHGGQLPLLWFASEQPGVLREGILYGSFVHLISSQTVTLTRFSMR